MQEQEARRVLPLLLLLPCLCILPCPALPCSYHFTMISSTKIHASPPLPGCHAGIFP